MKLKSLLVSIALVSMTTVAWGGPNLNGIVSRELISKVREIQSSCGSRIISGRDHRGGRSNHPIGRAVDLVGNPSCIYSHLSGWPGGYSTDYARAPGTPHVHISYNPGGQEWGLRFAHSGGHHHGRAYASRVREQFTNYAHMDVHAVH